MAKISILISVFNSSEFLEGFLKNLESQTCFSETEPIFIDANKDDSDYKILEPFLEKNKNCIYLKMPLCGIYAAWNAGLKKSSSELITNWNTDDRRFNDSLEMQIEFMNQNPHVDLCYGEVFVTDVKNEEPEKSIHRPIFPCYDFSIESMLANNSPHCMPVWRKSLHERFGFFNEKYLSAGDYEMWMRSIIGGAFFQKNYFPVGNYYRNPHGISSGEKTINLALKEVKAIRKYSYMFYSIKSKLLENFSALNRDEQLFYLENKHLFFPNLDESIFFEGIVLEKGQLFSKERKAIYEWIIQNKPEKVLEIGTYFGAGSTFFILLALFKNKFGTLITCECVDSYIEKAKNIYKSNPELLELSSRCEFEKTCSSKEIIDLLNKKGINKIDFLVLDGAEDGNQTLEQISYLTNLLPKGAGVFCHDWHTEKMSKVKDFFVQKNGWITDVELEPPYSIGCRIFKKS